MPVGPISTPSTVRGRRVGRRRHAGHAAAAGEQGGSEDAKR